MFSWTQVAIFCFMSALFGFMVASILNMVNNERDKKEDRHESECKRSPYSQQ